MELWTMVLRTLFIYFFILLIMRIMGKREIGKLSVFDLVVSIMIAELAVISIEKVEMPLILTLLPIVILFITQMTLSYVSLKSQKIRDIIDGKPSILVENGAINEEELKKQRYNMDDLLLQLRENNIHSLTQVEFAILEPTGKLSVFTKGEHKEITKKDLHIPPRQEGIPAILIKDGKVQEEGLDQLSRNRFWLKAELKKRTGSSRFHDISLCSVDRDGSWYIDFKDTH